jgi:hypothetical protein
MGGLVTGFFTNQENTNPIGGEVKHQAIKSQMAHPNHTRNFS